MLCKEAIQRLKNGFELLGESDEAFLKAVEDADSLYSYNISEYDGHKIYERAKKLKLSELKLKKLGLAVDAGPLNGEVASRVTDEIKQVGFKRKKTEERRSLLIGTYLQSRTIEGDLRGFVEEAEEVKSGRRRQKWLRVPDEEWSAGMNHHWMHAGIEQAYPFKIRSPLTDEMVYLLRTATTGLDFLMKVKTKYAGHTGTANPLWDDMNKDTEAHRPSYLAYELAELIDAKYKYSNSDGKMKMLPPGS